MHRFKYRAPRYRVDIPVRLTLAETTIPGRCREISREGMRLEVYQPLPADYSGTVFLGYQDFQLEIGVQMAHLGPMQDGLRFVFDSEQQRHAVAHLVTLLAEHPQQPGLVLVK